MDTAILVLLVLLTLLTLVNLGVSLQKPNQEKQSQVPQSPNYLTKLMTDQILEVRRLTNLLVSKNVHEFHAMQAVNPEVQQTSPLTNPEQTSSGSDEGFIWEGDGLSDEGFDNLPQ